VRGSELRHALSSRSPTAGLVLEGLRQPRAGRPSCRPAAEAERATGALIRPSEVDEQAAHGFLGELYSLLSAEAEDRIRHEDYTMGTGGI
jgi:hypothetical protein